MQSAESDDDDDNFLDPCNPPEISLEKAVPCSDDEENEVIYIIDDIFIVIMIA